MSIEERPRNRFMLRKESGHPGYSNTVVLATAEDLQKLSEDIRRLAESGRGRLDHHVTEERNPTSLGSVAFEVITEAELRSLQRGDWKHRMALFIGPAIFIICALLAVYGGYALLRRLYSTFTP